MKRITPNDKLADIVSENFMLFSVLNRLGIDMAYGELTVREACELRTLDINLFIVVVNTYIDNKYVPCKEHMNLSLKDLMSFLTKSHIAFREEFLPMLKGLFLEIREKDPKSGVAMVNDVYVKAQDQFVKHNIYEDEVVYPYVMKIIEGDNYEEDEEINNFIATSENSRHLKFNEEMQDLLYIFLKYVRPTCQLEMGKLIGVLTSFKTDLAHHMAIEDTYFYSQIKKKGNG